MAAISQNRAAALTLQYESTTHTEADLGIAQDTNTDPDSLSSNNGYVQFSTKKYMNKLELIRSTQEHSISSNRTILVVWHTQIHMCKICVSSEERSLTDPKCSHPWRWCGFNLNSYLCISVSAYNRSQRRPCTKIIVHFGRKPKIISGSPFETK